MSGMGGFAQQAQQLQSQMPANLQTQQAGAPEVGQIPGSTSGYRPPGGQQFGPGGGYYAPGTFDQGQGAGGGRPPGVPDWAPEGWQPWMGDPMRGSGMMSNLFADVYNQARLQEPAPGGGFGGFPGGGGGMPPGFPPPPGNYQDPVRQFGRPGEVGAPEYGFGGAHTRGPYNQAAFNLGMGRPQRQGGFTPGQYGRSGYGQQPLFGYQQRPVSNPFFAGLGGGGPRFGQNFGANFGGRGFNPFGGPSGQNYFGGGFRPFGGSMGYGGPLGLMGPGYAGSGMGMPMTSTYHSGPLRTGGPTPAPQQNVMRPAVMPPIPGMNFMLPAQPQGGAGLLMNPETGRRYGT